MRGFEKLLLLFPLLLSFVVVSCNQNGLGAITAARNFITTPIRAISGAISQSQYNSIAESSQGRTSEAGASASPECAGTNGAVIDIDTYEGLMRATRDNVCTCRPWGTCRKNLCSCDKLCPGGFEIFRRPPLVNSTDDLSAEEHSLAFRNGEAMAISSIRGTQGYCWGHASITTKFNRLGFFQPSNTEKRQHLNSAPGTRERTEAIEYYKKIIDDIVDNKVREIPGFENLNELSSHPDLQSYMADKAAHDWADRAMTFQGLSTAMGTSRMRNKKEAQKIIEDVKEKLSHNYQPQIVFTGEDRMGLTHAVLVSEVREIDGKTVMCIRDNNYPPSYNANCGAKLYYKENPAGFFYDSWGISLGKVVVAHNNESDVVDQHRALTRHCQSVKDCP